MTKADTCLSGVVLLEPRVFADERGSFFEAYHQTNFAALGISSVFVQDNHSISRRGVLRGLHYQLKRPQAKLCRVVRGEVMDVVLDIRRESPTFGRVVTAILSADNRRMIYVPEGFAHGFIALSDTVEFLYKCSDFYRPEDEYGVLWNDPQLGVDWRISDPVLSPRDAGFPPLRGIAASALPRYTKVGD